MAAKAPCVLSNTTREGADALAAFDLMLNDSSSTSTPADDLWKAICSYSRFQSIRNAISDTTRPMSTVFVYVSAIGSVLILATMCRNKRFDAPCFALFQALAIFELLRVAARIVAQISTLLGDSGATSFVWVCFAAVVRNLFNITLPNAMECLAIFLSLERAVATLWPTKFHLIESRVAFALAYGLSFGVAAFCHAPMICAMVIKYDERTGKYTASTADWMNTPGIKQHGAIVSNVFLVKGIVLVLMSLLSCVGMLKARFKRSRLLRQVNLQKEPSRGAGVKSELPNNHNSVSGLTKILRLCYLELCLTIPLAVNNILVTSVMFVASPSRSSLADVRLLVQDPSRLNAFYLYTILNMLLGLTDMIGHSCDFIFYVAFSRSFRLAFVQRVLSAVKWK